MLFRPTWAALYSWSEIQIVLSCRECDLFGACLILTLDSLFLEMVADSSDNCGLSVLACHSCSNVGCLDYPDTWIDDLDTPQ